MSKTQERFQRIQQQIQSLGLDAYLLPGTDPHQSEYLAPHWQVREGVTGFSGSYGNAVFTREGRGAVITDGRYTLQAEMQLKGSPYEPIIPKVKRGAFEEEINWTIAQLGRGCKIGIDPSLLTIQSHKALKRREEEGDFKLVLVDRDPAGEAWLERPAIDFRKIVKRDPGVDTLSRKEKLSQLQEIVRAKKVVHLISNLESVARILNLNGSDVGNDRLFFSYLLVAPDKAYLFCEPTALEAGLEGELRSDLEILPYREFFSRVDGLCRGSTVLLDATETSLKTYDLLKGQCDLIFDHSPAFDFKQIKTPAEMDQIAETHVIDGALLFEAFCVIREKLKSSTMTEHEVAMTVDGHRKAHPDFRGISFDTIAGYKENGAIVHYRPEEKGSKEVSADGMLLIDSGGHYRAGTTDVTRVLHLGGKVEPKQKEHYTRVMKGHIAIARLIFPETIVGKQIDLLARKALWEIGLDYQHGTGHGVGYGTCVHENIRVRFSAISNEPVAAGQVLSNEPGLYLSGQYGIRIENLVGIEVADFRGFLKFRQLTMVPYERALLDVSLLSVEERKWIDDYHAEVKRKLQDRLSPVARKYLDEACAPL